MFGGVHRSALYGGTHFTGGARFERFNFGADDLQFEGDFLFNGGAGFRKSPCINPTRFHSPPESSFPVAWDFL
jgi:hypothetical protein